MGRVPSMALHPEWGRSGRTATRSNCLFNASSTIIGSGVAAKDEMWSAKTPARMRMRIALTVFSANKDVGFAPQDNSGAGSCGEFKKTASGRVHVAIQYRNPNRETRNKSESIKSKSANWLPDQQAERWIGFSEDDGGTEPFEDKKFGGNAAFGFANALGTTRSTLSLVTL